MMQAVRVTPKGRVRGRGTPPVTRLKSVKSFFDFFSPIEVRAHHASDAEQAATLCKWWSLLTLTEPTAAVKTLRATMH